MSLSPRQIHCSGLFELRLKHFTNDNGKDNVNECCSGKSDDAGNCIGTCHTRFRVCLKNYQAKIDPTSTCTFGEVWTPVLGENSVNLTTQSTQALGFSNPIRFPFDFTWPVRIYFWSNLNLIFLFSISFFWKPKIRKTHSHLNIIHINIRVIASRHTTNHRARARLKGQNVTDFLTDFSNRVFCTHTGRRRPLLLCISRSPANNKFSRKGNRCRSSSVLVRNTKPRMRVQFVWWWVRTRRAHTQYTRTIYNQPNHSRMRGCGTMGR